MNQWYHSLLTTVDKVQGPQDAMGPSICKYFPIGTLHTKFSQTGKFTCNLAIFVYQ